MEDSHVLEIREDEKSGRGLFVTRELGVGVEVFCESALIESWGSTGKESQQVIPCQGQCEADSAFQAALECLCPNGVLLDEILDQIALVDYRSDEPVLEAWLAEFDGFSDAMLEQYRFSGQEAGNDTPVFPFLGHTGRSLSPSFPIVRLTLSSLLQILKEHEGEGQLSRSQIIKYFYSVFLNSFELNGVNNTQGKGQFPVLSLCNHSCEPNCYVQLGKKKSGHNTVKTRVMENCTVAPLFHSTGIKYVFTGKEQDIEATEQMHATLVTMRPLHVGEELSISYIDYTVGVKVRQAQLRESYGFHCICKKCVNPPSLKKNILLPIQYQYNTLRYEKSIRTQSIEQFPNVMEYKEKYIILLKQLYTQNIGASVSQQYLDSLTMLRKQPDTLENRLFQKTSLQHKLYHMHVRLSGLILACQQIGEKWPTFLIPSDDVDSSIEDLHNEQQQCISIWSSLVCSCLVMLQLCTCDTVEEMEELLQYAGESCLKRDVLQKLMQHVKLESTPPVALEHVLTHFPVPTPLSAEYSWQLLCQPKETTQEVLHHVHGLLQASLLLLKSTVKRQYVLKKEQFVPNDPALYSYNSAIVQLQQYFP